MTFNKGLTYFQFIVIKRSEIETIEKSNSTYVTKFGQATSILKQHAGKSLLNSNLESQLGKDPGSVSKSQLTLQIAVLGAPVYNPRLKTGISIRWCTKKYSFTKLFHNFCESQEFLDLGGLARTPGAQDSQDPPPFLSKGLPDCCGLQVSR